LDRISNRGVWCKTSLSATEERRVVIKISQKSPSLVNTSPFILYRAVLITQRILMKDDMPDVFMPHVASILSSLKLLSEMF